MNIQIISKKVEDLSSSDIKFMNNARIKEYGKKEVVDFKKEDINGEFIFVKDKGKVVAFGMMKPIKLELNSKNYVIYGIGRGMAIEKGKGYGKILNKARISKLKKTGKTGVAFTSRHNIGFFEKAGYKIKKNGIRRFVYKNPEGKLISDKDGDMVYYEGKDKLISKLLKSRNKAIVFSDFW